MSTPKKDINFTQRDFELLAKAMSCTKEPMTIDYQKLAEAVPFKNANSAKASWHTIKKKIEALSEGAAMKGETSGATPAKKRKSEADDGVEAEAPAKTPKKARKTSTKAKASEEDGEQDMPSDVKSGIKSETDAALKEEPSDD
ncbi:hypothetical protein AC578_468 [Pseudocercospora eumusae]|uniref:Uncharacterized protein n=1 Tax=Pseudocercospora eumusae TaxID=321146 RepID=A0A139HXX6_9PEZI|nr:hypothetical protein AC578_468 [Pseudocercospora eumusae]